MEHTEGINHSKGIIVLQIKGEITLGSFNPIAKKARRKAKELNYVLIYDLRLVQCSLSMVDVFHYFEDNYGKSNLSLFQIPVALLVSEINDEFWGYVIMLFKKTGAKMELFKEEEPALEWLQNQASPPSIVANSSPINMRANLNFEKKTAGQAKRRTAV